MLNNQTLYWLIATITACVIVVSGHTLIVIFGVFLLIYSCYVLGYLHTTNAEDDDDDEIITVTQDEEGNVVAVTLQTEEGQILAVVWEREENFVKENLTEEQHF